MVIGVPLPFVMVVESALDGEFAKGASDTLEHVGSVGPVGVDVGVIGVLVNVSVGGMGVFVRVGVGVFVRVGVMVNVRVGPGVFVGPGVLVLEGVNVGVGDSVAEGRTSRVFVAGMVAEGVKVREGVSVSVGVDVICPSICLCASDSDNGIISVSVQYFPVMVQAIFSSSSASGSGSDGGLIASFPFSPPNLTFDLCPAPTYCSCPSDTILAEPL